LLFASIWFGLVCGSGSVGAAGRAGEGRVVPTLWCLRFWCEIASAFSPYVVAEIFRSFWGWVSRREAWGVLGEGLGWVAFECCGPNIESMAV
jgi:hypothetical protein